MARVKYLSVKSSKAKELTGTDADPKSGLPNFHRSGSVKEMKNQFYGQDALLVQCGQWIYNVTSKPEIYHEYAN
jgi:hypothetical protein